MKKLKAAFLFVVLMSVLQLNASAQTENSLLWKISGNGLKQSSYLFGTMHMICPQYFVWTDKMQYALEQTQQLCLELPMADSGFQTQVLNLMKTKGDSTLKDYFSENDYQKLQGVFSDSLHIPIDIFSKFKPFFLLSFFVLHSVGCEVPIAYETKLISMDSARGIHRVIGLETAKEQIDYIDNLPKDSLQQMIMKDTDSLEKSKEEYAKMESDYSQQKLSAVYERISSSKTLEDNLVDNRNEKWIPKLKIIMKETPTFIAVGAGHLLGENGVINLLRKEGYKVEPVL